MTIVSAPSRLHFGLLHLPQTGFSRWPGIDGEAGLPARQFGGMGLMLDQPQIRIAVEPVTEWGATGKLHHRALEFARQFTRSLDLDPRTAFRIEVLDCPDEHVGLGVGTALALSVAKGIAVETGHSDWDSVELAKRVGRGERSAIGVHGFQRGGLIVEAGKLPHEAVSPLLGSYPFPENWGFLLCSPKVAGNWSGTRERQAFQKLANQSHTQTEALCRILITSLLPALLQRDFEPFSEALYEFNYRVGLMFSSVQGGVYTHPEVAQLVQQLRKMGIRGVGQSSWGPTVFALVDELAGGTKISNELGPEVVVQFVRVSSGVRVDSP